MCKIPVPGSWHPRKTDSEKTWGGVEKRGEGVDFRGSQEPESPRTDLPPPHTLMPAFAVRTHTRVRPRRTSAGAPRSRFECRRDPITRSGSFPGAAPAFPGAAPPGNLRKMCCSPLHPCRGDSLQRRFATLRHTRSGQKDTRTTKTGDHQWLTHKHCLLSGMGFRKLNVGSRNLS